MDSDTKLVQEWLCLHGLRVVVDGIMGPATRAALKEFQKGKGLKADGSVNDETVKLLVAPAKRAMAKVEVDDMPLSHLVRKCAKQHLAEWPREVGGQNRGPWVRLYMDGNEGPNWPWCAGFVMFILKQACDSARVQMPLKKTFHCDTLGGEAKGRAVLIPAESVLSDLSLIDPGYLFLVRQGGRKDDWAHVGVVAEVGEVVFQTIEGNTNDDGSHEGYEVCARIRSIAGKDFIAI